MAIFVHFSVPLPVDQTKLRYDFVIVDPFEHSIALNRDQMLKILAQPDDPLCPT